MKGEIFNLWILNETILATASNPRLKYFSGKHGYQVNLPVIILLKYVSYLGHFFKVKAVISIHTVSADLVIFLW